MRESTPPAVPAASAKPFAAPRSILKVNHHESLPSELKAQLLEDIAARRKLAEQAWTKGDRESLFHLAHQLAGLSGHLDDSSGDLWREVEQASRSDRWDEARKIMEKIPELQGD